MPLDPTQAGAAIRARRIAAGLTQAALAERLSVSAQVVSCWERSETLPDISLLPDLALILNCSVDALLGTEHFMVRTMLDALDRRMNSRIEAALTSEGAMDAYVCEALLECIRQGDWVDATDVRRHIRSDKARAYTLQHMQSQGIK